MGERRAPQVADQALEAGTVVGTHGAIGVEIEAFEVRVALADPLALAAISAFWSY